MLRHVALISLLLTSIVEAAPAKLCIVGDSISAGFSPATHGWNVPLAPLNAGTNWGVKNVAHSGDQVDAARIVFDRNVYLRGCTWTAFLIGTNNLAAGDTALTIWQGAGGTTGIKAMVDLSVASGSRVLMLAILPRGSGPAWSSGLQTNLVALNALMSAYDNGTTRFFVDTYTPMIQPASNPPALANAYGGATDGLHPDDAGQAEIASLVQAVAGSRWTH